MRPANMTIADYEKLVKTVERQLVRLEAKYGKAQENENLSPTARTNDAFRRTFGVLGRGRVLQTSGFLTLLPASQSKARELIEMFKDFTPKNDPYGEHDFGKVTVKEGDEDQDVFWKIDYYDSTYEHGVLPTDPDCHRVMTIMLAEEY